jgi:phosphatidylglycerophosphate synthase
MTFLDTVDGKLARVTLTSSKFGHYFDHVIDLVHPPLWYIVWALGLPAAQVEALGWPLSTFFWLILAGYIGGRLVEGSFQLLLGKFSIFCWQPVDSYFRLITARRNPNLILLTLSYLTGRPDLGLVAVTLWTVTSTIFLLLRLATAGYERVRQGRPLGSWLAEADTPRYMHSRAARIFTGRQSR